MNQTTSLVSLGHSRPSDAPASMPRAKGLCRDLRTSAPAPQRLLAESPPADHVVGCGCRRRDLLDRNPRPCAGIWLSGLKGSRRRQMLIYRAFGLVQANGRALETPQALASRLQRRAHPESGWSGDLGPDGIQEADELLMAVPLHAAADADHNVESGKERGCSIALIIMRQFCPKLESGSFRSHESTMACSGAST
jgi:hypothetical protein